MKNVRPWCGQPLDWRRLKNRTKNRTYDLCDNTMRVLNSVEMFCRALWQREKLSCETDANMTKCRYQAETSDQTGTFRRLTQPRRVCIYILAFLIFRRTVHEDWDYDVKTLNDWKTTFRCEVNCRKTVANCTITVVIKCCDLISIVCRYTGFTCI